MGIYDSTKTRVTPVFDALRSSGQPWLHTLLRLPSLGHPRPQTWDGLDLTIDEIAYGEKEKRLPAHPALLDWLAGNASDVTGKGLTSCTAATARKRELLLQKDQATITEARDLLRTDRSEKRWQVLEGPSCPDVFIRTPDLLVVIEGKRTEAGPTTSTTWMALRHQMLRHIDGAHGVADGRTVVGFFIVQEDANGGVPAHWQTAATDTIKDSNLTGSLPHRSETEREQIARGFLGVTTWQAVCRAFEIDERTLPETVVS